MINNIIIVQLIPAHLQANEAHADWKKGNENKRHNNADGDADRDDIGRAPDDICQLHGNLPVNNLQVRCESVDDSPTGVSFKEGKRRMHGIVNERVVHFYRGFRHGEEGPDIVY